MTEYFHGGYGKLHVGDLVKPPSVTDAPSSASYGNHLCKRDRVYITTIYSFALYCAAMYPSEKGKVYQVKPVGDLEPDLDCSIPGISFECKAARVVKVHRLRGKDRKKIRRMEGFAA